MIILILIIFLSALFILGTIALYVVPYLMDFYIKISKLFLFIPMGILLAIGVLIYKYQFKYKEINYNQGRKQYNKNSLGKSNSGTQVNYNSHYNKQRPPSGNSSFQNNINERFFSNESSNEGSFVNVRSNTESSNTNTEYILPSIGRSPPNNFFILYTIFITLSIVFCIILSIIITTSNKIIITNKKHENFQVDCNCNICKEYYAKPYNTY